MKPPPAVKDAPPIPSSEAKLQAEAEKKAPEPETARKSETVRIEKEADEKFVILNFYGAEIETVISTIGELLNINYILSPGVTGKITIQSYKKFPVRDLFQIFQSILELNGLTAVQDGSLYRIIPIDSAKQQPVKVETGKGVKMQIDGAFVTQIIPLEYVKAADVASIIRNLMPRGADIVVYEPTNLLIVTALNSSLIKFMKLLEAIDIPPTDREMVRTFVYYVEHGEAKKLVELLKGLYAEKKSGGVTVPRSAPPQAPRGPASSVSSAPVNVEGDLPGEIEGGVTIAAYDAINALVVKTTPKGYLSLLETLKKLDVPAKQVLIEVLVAEMTLDDSEKLGIEWMVKGSGRVSGEDVFTSGGFTTKDSPITLGSVGTGIVSYPNGVFANIFNPGKFNALIAASVSTGNFKVLASPHILALDNKEAKIEIGKEVAVATGTYTTQPTSTTSTSGSGVTTVGQIQYKTTGIILTVTPQINDKGLVVLKISQEMSDVVETTTVQGIPAPSFSTRKANTMAVIQDGHTLVIGGLLNERIEKTRVGIPFLSRIPVLGYLFGSTNDKVTKTELLVLVTPRVVRSSEDADILTRDFQNKVKTIRNIDKKGNEK
jgi:general secretion pathway protein D